MPLRLKVYWIVVLPSLWPRSIATSRSACSQPVLESQGNDSQRDESQRKRPESSARQPCVDDQDRAEMSHPSSAPQAAGTHDAAELAMTATADELASASKAPSCASVNRSRFSPSCSRSTLSLLSGTQRSRPALCSSRRSARSQSARTGSSTQEPDRDLLQMSAMEVMPTVEHVSV